MTQQKVFLGDSLSWLRQMPDESVHCVVTSPPYWGLRDYGVDGQMGIERTFPDYVVGMRQLFTEVKRVLRNDGTLWLNLGDTYAGSWGAQSRPEKSNYGDQGISANSMNNHPKGLRTGSKDRYPGIREKSLIGIPWRVAFALQEDGWILRSDIIWHKPNPMPESVIDRPTKSHEYLFLFSKSERYYYDSNAVKEPAVGKTAHDLTGSGYEAPGQTPNRGNRKRLATQTYSRHRSSVPGGQDLRAEPDGKRNRRTVWTIPTSPYKGAHFATFPPALVEPCILAGCPAGGMVLDPFAGSGTTLAVAKRLGRMAIGFELNPEYVKLAEERIAKVGAQKSQLTAPTLL